MSSLPGPEGFSPLSVVIDLLYLPTPSLSKPLVKIEIENCPSLIQSSKYWLSTFCVLQMRKEIRMGKLKEGHFMKETHIGKRK